MHSNSIDVSFNFNQSLTKNINLKTTSSDKKPINVLGESEISCMPGVDGLGWNNQLLQMKLKRLMINQENCNAGNGAPFHKFET